MGVRVVRMSWGGEEKLGVVNGFVVDILVDIVYQ